MIEFHKVWVEQCEGARGIKEQFGSEKALGYLIGEKLVNSVRASDEHPEFTAELPKINVVAIGRATPRWKYPKVIKRVGESPPQYVDWDEED